MDAGVVEVRIRGEFGVEAVPFTACRIGALSSLLSQLAHWGVVIDGEGRQDLFGQFVVEDHAAYFEIIVAETDDA